MILLLFFLIIILFLIIIYYFKIIKKFKIFYKIPNVYLKYLIILIPNIIIYLLLGYVNLFVILIHFELFFLLSKFIIFLINKKNTIYLEGFLALFITIIYLGIGFFNYYHIVPTMYQINTNKNIQDLTIISISDSHLSKYMTSNRLLKYINEINQIDYDLVVITGDYVDDNTTYDEMIKATSYLKELKPKYGTYFIYGNHDKGYFNYRNFTSEELENELIKNNITILKDEVQLINNEFYLIGRCDKSDNNRKSMNELVNNIDNDKYIIVLDHQPNDYDNEMKANVDLVLSGHTHGGQLFPLGYVGLWTKANDEFYGLHQRNKTNFIVNSGISDWELIFKTGTKSEYNVIKIRKNA